MAELSNYEIARRKAFAEFVAAQSLPEWVLAEVDDMPVCARMPLQLIWYANERNDETKQNFNFLFKLYQVVLQLYKRRCPLDSENNPDYFIGYFIMSGVSIPRGELWQYCRPFLRQKADDGDKVALFMLDYRAEVAEAVQNAFGGEIPENVLGFMIDQVIVLLAEYAEDVKTLYSKAEKSPWDRSRLYSDNREYYNHRDEFKLLQHEMFVDLKQPSRKDSEDFFERYRYC